MNERDDLRDVFKAWAADMAHAGVARRKCFYVELYHPGISVPADARLPEVNFSLWQHFEWDVRCTSSRYFYGSTWTHDSDDLDNLWDSAPQEMLVIRVRALSAEDRAKEIAALKKEGFVILTHPWEEE